MSYQLTGADDKLRRRLNALYKKRKREAGGGYVGLDGKWIVVLHKQQVVDEVVAAGLEALENRVPILGEAK